MHADRKRSPFSVGNRLHLSRYEDEAKVLFSTALRPLIINLEGSPLPQGVLTHGCCSKTYPRTLRRTRLTRRTRRASHRTRTDPPLDEAVEQMAGPRRSLLSACAQVLSHTRCRHGLQLQQNDDPGRFLDLRKRPISSHPPASNLILRPRPRMRVRLGQLNLGKLNTEARLDPRRTSRQPHDLKTSRATPSVRSRSASGPASSSRTPAR
jgi:hypothetical protein